MKWIVALSIFLGKVNLPRAAPERVKFEKGHLLFKMMISLSASMASWDSKLALDSIETASISNKEVEGNTLPFPYPSESVPS